ncbi:small ribosomal subunit Rsm22 family protein [Streptomyces sp. SM14]|uniref:small ribosomal subunit Rsm22 family protein n=1 Tax=Streptomyces sp. SM14 TaxID=1736045 RepID=UPI002156685D|nr:small ribosomal subunit Rsm22 family protein [Streptomyces sp. SM14]
MNTTTDDRLRGALDALLDGLPPRQLSGAVERLMTHYRGRTPTGAPILRDRADAVAYAAYRMPATAIAVGAALGELADRLPGWAPGSHLDLGGGTGAAVWAVAGTWPGGRPVTVLDWAGPALDLGRELCHGARDEALEAVSWRQERIASGLRLPPAGLVTASYVLGELTEEARDALADAAAATGGAVVIAEPGTPDGYLRVIRARDRLVAAGLRVLAPCPHSDRCPIEAGTDWCHFAARVARSSLHRRVKGGELPYEDEKFSYVAAVPPGLAPDPRPAASRIVRRPQQRKGQVLLDLCTTGDGLRRTTVTKRDRDAYRAARDAEWGEPWPPPGGERAPD